MKKNKGKMQLGVTTFIALVSLSFSPSLASAKTTVAYVEYTPGVDEGTNTLLPNSDWRLEIAPTFTTSCEDIAPGLTFYKTAQVSVSSYINRNLDCNNTTHPGFEDEVGLDWVDNGLVQRPEFGNENISCPIYGSCEMERVVTATNKYFDNIILQNGENGTPSGSAKVFVAKLGSSTVSATPGQGGIGGRNDLSGITGQNRYCAKVTDALSVDGTEETAKVPYAQIMAYNWLPFNITGGGQDGANATSNRRVEIFEGLSETSLYQLRDIYFE